VELAEEIARLEKYEKTCVCSPGGQDHHSGGVAGRQIFTAGLKFPANGFAWGVPTGGLP